MIEVLLKGMKMDPLVSLHYYAPVGAVSGCADELPPYSVRQVCAAINLLILPFAEGLQPFRDLGQLSPLILISNASIAFLLNVAAVFLIGVGSGLILTLAGVLKVIYSVI